MGKRQKFKRALLHIPVGVFNIFCGYVSWIYALIFFGSFMVYEVTEDWRLKDHAYIDLYGYLIGLGLGVTGLFLFMTL